MKWTHSTAYIFHGRHGAIAVFVADLKEVVLMLLCCNIAHSSSYTYYSCKSYQKTIEIFHLPRILDCIQCRRFGWSVYETQTKSFKTFCFRQESWWWIQTLLEVGFASYLLKVLLVEWRHQHIHDAMLKPQNVIFL